MQVACRLSSKLTGAEHHYKTLLGKGLFFPVPMRGGSAPHSEEGSHSPCALPQPQKWGWDGAAGAGWALGLVWQWSPRAGHTTLRREEG